MQHFYGAQWQWLALFLLWKLTIAKLPSERWDKFVVLHVFGLDGEKYSRCPCMQQSCNMVWDRNASPRCCINLTGTDPGSRVHDKLTAFQVETVLLFCPRFSRWRIIVYFFLVCFQCYMMSDSFDQSIFIYNSIWRIKTSHRCYFVLSSLSSSLKLKFISAWVSHKWWRTRTTHRSCAWSFRFLLELLTKWCHSATYVRKNIVKDG
jgi:hypothetical protein